MGHGARSMRGRVHGVQAHEVRSGPRSKSGSTGPRGFGGRGGRRRAASASRSVERRRGFLPAAGSSSAQGRLDPERLTGEAWPAGVASPAGRFRRRPARSGTGRGRHLEGGGAPGAGEGEQGVSAAPPPGSFRRTRRRPARTGAGRGRRVDRVAAPANPVTGG